MDDKYFYYILYNIGILYCIRILFCHFGISVKWTEGCNIDLLLALLRWGFNNLSAYRGCKAGFQYCISTRSCLVISLIRENFHFNLSQIKRTFFLQLSIQMLSLKSLAFFPFSDYMCRVAQWKTQRSSKL